MAWLDSKGWAKRIARGEFVSEGTQVLLREIEGLRAVLYEVSTNGEWTEGEQRGDWKISKMVYETVRDALEQSSGG